MKVQREFPKDDSVETDKNPNGGAFNNGGNADNQNKGIHGLKSMFSKKLGISFPQFKGKKDQTQQFDHQNNNVCYPQNTQQQQQQQPYYLGQYKTLSSSQNTKSYIQSNYPYPQGQQQQQYQHQQQQQQQYQQQQQQLQQTLSGSVSPINVYPQPSPSKSLMSPQQSSLSSSQHYIQGNYQQQQQQQQKPQQSLSGSFSFSGGYPQPSPQLSPPINQSHDQMPEVKDMPCNVLNEMAGILPAGWEAKTDKNKRIYYSNLMVKNTEWRISAPLPADLVEYIDPKTKSYWYAKKPQPKSSQGIHGGGFFTMFCEKK